MNFHQQAWFIYQVLLKLIETENRRSNFQGKPFGAQVKVSVLEHHVPTIRSTK